MVVPVRQDKHQWLLRGPPHDTWSAVQQAIGSSMATAVYYNQFRQICSLGLVSDVWLIYSADISVKVAR